MCMERPRDHWEDRYETQDVTTLPWYTPDLDTDFDQALERYGITSGRVLDVGSGPGTQAAHLARRGFVVLGSDVSQAAVDGASKTHGRVDGRLTFVRDDILDSGLTGTFDLVFDRGCFHTQSPDKRKAYAATMERLLGPTGTLMVKTFSTREPGTDGPHRISPEILLDTFTPVFDIVELRHTEFRTNPAHPRQALFAVLRLGGPSR